MSKLPIFNSKLFLLIVISIFINSYAKANADEILDSKNYRYFCGYSGFKSNFVNSSCGYTFKILEPKLDQKRSPFIFQSKISGMKYQESADHDTGIADYLVSTILGVYFPTLENLTVSSGGSFFGGIKLKENIRLDAEIVGIFEGNSLEKAYFDLATFLSLRFSVPLSHKKGYPLLYVSPGLGISELDERYTNRDDEDTHPTWQIEGGVAIPIYNNLGGYGGLKYVHQLNQAGDNFLGTEWGITLRL